MQHHTGRQPDTTSNKNHLAILALNAGDCATAERLLLACAQLLLAEPGHEYALYRIMHNSIILYQQWHQPETATLITARATTYRAEHRLPPLKPGHLYEIEPTQRDRESCTLAAQLSTRK